jgi:hypothetical protein
MKKILIIFAVLFFSSVFTEASAHFRVDGTFYITKKLGSFTYFRCAYSPSWCCILNDWGGVEAVNSALVVSPDRNSGYDKATGEGFFTELP